MSANVWRAILAHVMLASGLCSASIASAQDAAPSECETTAGARRCLARRLDSAEVELRTVLARARREAQGKALLDSAQAAWRVFMGRDCRAAADVYRGGSLAPVVAQACRLDHIRMRIEHLRNDYLSDERAPGRRASEITAPTDSLRLE